MCLMVHVDRSSPRLASGKSERYLRLSDISTLGQGVLFEYSFGGAIGEGRTAGQSKHDTFEPTNGFDDEIFFPNSIWAAAHDLVAAGEAVAQVAVRLKLLG